MLWTRFSSIEVRGQGHSDPKKYAPLPNPKVYPHTKYGIPTANIIGDMLCQG